MKRILQISVAWALASTAWAAVKPNSLFSDNAVLQQDANMPVWGTAGEGENVTVTFDGQSEKAVAKNGRWMVRLKPHKAGGPFTLTIAGENTITVNNVLVGEVWVCAGQSNMAFPLAKAATWNTEGPSANYPKLRMFKVELVNSITPETDVVGKWVECSTTTAKDFSAAGYYFGRDLHKAIGRPVGLIQAAANGSSADFWTSLSALKKEPSLHAYIDRLGKKPPKEAKSTDPFNKFPSCYFNGMIAPLIPYAIRGTVWYQGESNGGKPFEYRTLFPLLIADWREKWGQGGFPFLFVQIVPFQGNPAELREAQLLTWKKTPNTAMVVTTDTPPKIHPPEKEPVGARLALAARALVYGEKLEYSGPEYDSVKIEQNQAVVSFKHVGGGLVAKDGPLKGFALAGADKQFVAATAEIQGDTVVVSSPRVAAPVAVRYGFEAVPNVNLWNKDGLPASPFRTDPESLTQDLSKSQK